MILAGKETITSVNFNFANAGSSHSLSIESIKGAKDLANSESELGSIIGSTAGKSTFSNSQIQKIANNFIEIQKTTKRDGVSTVVIREYQDATSLRLKSHCFIVRGRDCHPKDELSGGGTLNPNARFVIQRRNGSYLPDKRASTINPALSQPRSEEVTIPYFGECSGSGITLASQRFPLRKPKKINGGIIAIGNIYNEEVSVDSTGARTSLIYQDGEIKEDLCFNLDRVSLHYRNNPELSNYELRFGYTLTEAKQAFAIAGINLIGLPNNDNILFENSGTLDSILSSIAAKFGYYYYIDPFVYGLVRFVDSSIAASSPIINPLEQSLQVQKSYVSASFTQDKSSPVIVNAFNAKIEPLKSPSFTFGDSQRHTRFRKLSPIGLLDLIDIPDDLYKLYYGLYLSGNYSASNYDMLAFYVGKFKEELKISFNWPNKPEGFWPSFGKVKDFVLHEDFKKAYKIKRDRTTIKKRYPLFDNGFSDAKFIDLRVTQHPSHFPNFERLKEAFDLFFNSIFFSNYYLEFQARRIQWSNSEMTISGPFKKNTIIDDIEAFADLRTALTKLGFNTENITLSQLMDISGCEGTGSYGFVGIKSNASKLSEGLKKEDFDYSLLNSENFDFTGHNGGAYLAISSRLFNKLPNLIKKSAKAFNNVDKKGPQTCRAAYTRVKRLSDQEDSESTRKEEEAEARRIAGLDALAAKIDAIKERFDTKYYSLKSNGATGDPLRPITLDIKGGKIADIKALESDNFSSFQSNQRLMAKSSRTIVGVRLPENFKPTLVGITLEFGSSGVTTTIKESNVKLLRPDEQLIIDANNRAFVNIKNNIRLSATQKNLLGL